MTMKTTALTLLLLASSLVSAKEWNDAAVEQLGEQALIAINQFIDKDNRSNINNILSADERERLRQQMLAQNLPLVHVVDTVLKPLKRRYRYQDALPYIALRHQLYQNADTGFELYEALLRDNDDVAPYAFAKLDALALVGRSELLEKREQLHKNYGFRLESSHTDSDNDLPEVCVRFSKRVRQEPAQDWQSLISVTPAPRQKLTYRSDQLCFTGDWQTRYTIDVDKRLQSINRLALRKPTTEVINTGARPAMMRFATDGYVLDGQTQRQLALTTANIDNVAVTLWQIPANNLSNDDIQDLIQSPQSLSTWRTSRMLPREAVKRFTGTFAVGAYVANESVVTNIPFADLIKNTEQTAGIYVLSAKNADTDDESAQIAFSVTNAGFSAYSTSAGLWAELRNLQTAQPLSGRTVTLYAQNNAVLGTATTDDKGVAYFPKPQVVGKDGLTPSHVISETTDDNGSLFAYLNIQKTPVDLSDKGLSGVVENAPLRSWIWTDRGIYRPNDTAHVMWLLKNHDGKPFNSAPIWLELLRPDGETLQESLIKPEANGSYSFDYYFANTAPQGDWTLRLSLGKNGAFLAQKTIPVAAIAPQQIEAKIEPLKEAMGAEQDISVTVQADWLYGAPASQLSTTLERRFVENDLAKHDNRWTGWQVGLHDEKRYQNRQNNEVATTDAKGTATFALNTGAVAFTTQPLAVKFTAKVTEPSGQNVHAVYEKPLSRNAPYLALKNTGEKTVQVALIDNAGTVQAGKVKWQLYRTDYDYYWYKKGSQWHYQHNENRTLVESGDIGFDGTGVVQLDLDVDDGTWVLVVRGDDAQTAGSIPLEFGYYSAPSKGSAPDRIDITSDKTRYADGEKVTLHLSAPFNGKASIKLAHNDGIVDNHLVTFTERKATLTFNWRSEWDNGLWLLANAWNADQQKSYSRRAVGLHWVGGDLSVHAIAVTADLPEKIEPNTTLSIPLFIPSQANANGDATWARIAVIDDGLYQLAKPSFNSPLDVFWAKKQLNANFYDVWGDIIRQVEARQASLRSGADGMPMNDNLKALPELDLQLVAFWSAPVQFDADGKATVKMDIPQFNGRLRVMGAVWNGDGKLGAVEQTVQVRAPLVATLYTPPYLSPKDSSQLRLRLHNTTTAPMTVTPAITQTALTMENAESAPITLQPDQQQWLSRPFSVASDAEQQRATVAVNLSGDDSTTLNRFIDIRPTYAPVQSQQFTVLNPNNRVALETLGHGKLLERNVFLSTNAPFNPKQTLMNLYNYPYGCSEQITSQSWSNLFLDELMAKFSIDNPAWGDSATRENNLQTVHRALANRQASNGSFSLWGGGYDDRWLSAYISEFLLASHQAGQLHNPLVLERALKYLRYQVMINNAQTADIAYAHYVLAKAGEPVQGATLRFGESRLMQDKATLSTATLHTISALVNHGEMNLAEKLLAGVSTQGYPASEYATFDHYGANLRNIAQSLVVLYDLQKQLQKQGASQSMQTATARTIATLLPQLSNALRDNPYHSTQDLHWLAMLANHFPKADSPATLTIDGKPLTVRGSQWIQKRSDQALQVVNTSNTPVYITQNDWRVPTELTEVKNGFGLTMHYEDAEGNPIDIKRLKQNQQVVAVATIAVDAELENADLLLAYPLPAGLTAVDFDAYQISSHSPSDPRYANIAQPTHSENRDDRHIATFNLRSLSLSDKRTFTHVFMLRATQKGTWHAPEHSVEAMYQPQFRAVKRMPIVVVE